MTLVDHSCAIGVCNLISRLTHIALRGDVRARRQQHPHHRTMPPVRSDPQWRVPTLGIKVTALELVVSF